MSHLVVGGSFFVLLPFVLFLPPHRYVITCHRPWRRFGVLAVAREFCSAASRRELASTDRGVGSVAPVGSLGRCHATRHHTRPRAPDACASRPEGQEETTSSQAPAAPARARRSSVPRGRRTKLRRVARGRAARRRGRGAAAPRGGGRRANGRRAGETVEIEDEGWTTRSPQGSSSSSSERRHCDEAVESIIVGHRARRALGLGRWPSRGGCDRRRLHGCRVSVRAVGPGAQISLVDDAAPCTRA